MTLSRRDMLRATAGAGALAALGLTSRRALGSMPPRISELLMRPIPSSGETIPAIGIGTARRYDVQESSEEMAVLKEVLAAFAMMGGRVVDTAPSYGRAEIVVGELVDAIGNRDDLFLATKVRAEGREAGIDQMEESLRRLHTDRIDLMQVHNLVDVETQLATLREWKAAGRIRYLGITTSFDRQYEDFERVMREQTMDFIQVNYSLGDRGAGERILPLAADRGMAVLVNLPYARGRLFQKVGDRPLPRWAAEFDCESWGQFFLKFVLSEPAVTCAIPGTAKMTYLEDNLGAARGRLPDPELRQRMITFYDSL
ncbi:MAG: aldo/keto reductase [Gemmatimonadales bacterium]|jgi:aryl-alcohol dehydrogenase-like predicted oxidoreductase